MPRRLWFAAAMLVTGASLIGCAQLAGAAPETKGGIFKFGTVGASVEVDPQVAYITTSWWLEILPGLVIVLFAVSVTTLGRTLQRRLEGASR